MAIKIGINGYGRIGRQVVRAIHEYGRTSEFDVVALNCVSDFISFFDCVGRYRGEILLYVPGASSVRVSERRHDLNEAFRFGEVSHGIYSGIGQQGHGICPGPYIDRSHKIYYGTQIDRLGRAATYNITVSVHRLFRHKSPGS